MPNVATVLKDEIARISRKEIRRSIDPLKKQIAALRHDAAALKRDRDQLRRELATQMKAVQRGNGASKPKQSEGPQVRFAPAGLLALRRRLGVSAEELGALVGVSGQSIYNWEQGKARPRKRQLVRIAEVRALGKRDARRQLEELPQAKPKKARAKGKAKAKPKAARARKARAPQSAAAAAQG